MAFVGAALSVQMSFLAHVLGGGRERGFYSASTRGKALCWVLGFHCLIFPLQWSLAGRCHNPFPFLRKIEKFAQGRGTSPLFTCGTADEQGKPWRPVQSEQSIGSWEWSGVVGRDGALKDGQKDICTINQRWVQWREQLYYINGYCCRLHTLCMKISLHTVIIWPHCWSDIWLSHLILIMDLQSRRYYSILQIRRPNKSVTHQATKLSKDPSSLHHSRQPPQHPASTTPGGLSLWCGSEHWEWRGLG